MDILTYIEVNCTNKKISISKASELSGVTEAVEGNKRLEPNEGMVQDLISIVTCFSARLYGTRGGRKIKKAIKELEKRRGEDCENNNQSNIS